MKYMLSWKIPTGSYRPALEAFLTSGAPMPDGLKSHGRWHAPGSANGWIVVEGDEVALAEHVGEWSHLLNIRVTPVIDDSQAAEAGARVAAK